MLKTPATSRSAAREQGITKPVSWSTIQSGPLPRRFFALFFETHDPTQANGQGPDIGPQYRSAVFYQNDAQRDLTQSLIGLLTAKGLDVATEVLPAQAFYSAEGYHQDYYDMKGGTPYCHGYRKLF
jgi:peptide methionine sulfoxide reductase msrA/msrB